MLRVYPNFLSEEKFAGVNSQLDRSILQDVPNTPNVKSCPARKFGVKDYVEQFGQLSFTELLVYPSGSESPLHVDGGYNIDWKYTGILLCNDTYEGGELYFPDLGVELKPPPNTFIIFPAGPDSHIYAHGVKPVKSGERITAIFRFI